MLDLYPRIYPSIPLYLPRKRGGEWEPRAAARMPLPVLQCPFSNANHARHEKGRELAAPGQEGLVK